MHTGRTTCEDEDRDQGDASTSQGIPHIAHKPVEVRVEARNRFSLIALKEPILPTP